MNERERESIAEVAAGAAQNFIDKLDEHEVLDSDLLWDAVYHATLAALASRQP